VRRAPYAHPPRDRRPRRLHPRGAQIGFNEAEDHNHTVTDSRIVVVTKNDEPFLGPIAEDALRIEAEPTTGDHSDLKLVIYYLVNW
jgi:hypothetical protein